VYLCRWREMGDWFGASMLEGRETVDEGWFVTARNLYSSAEVFGDAACSNFWHHGINVPDENSAKHTVQ
jgi:hypothetical protein